MKIGIITPLEPEKALSKYSELLASQLVKEGLEVTIIGPNMNRCVQENIRNASVNFISADKFVKKPTKYDIIHFQLANSPYIEFELHYAEKARRRTSHTIATLHDPRSIKAMNLRCLKCISFYLREWALEPLTSPFEVIDKSFQRISDWFIFHSEYMMKEYLHKHECSTPGEVIPLFPLLTNRNKIESSNSISKNQDFYQNDREIKRLLVPGYISPFKGDDVIINAIGRIKNNFKLIFMGKVVNRKYYRYLKNLILRNNLEGKVEFTGFVDDKRFVEEFNKAYVVIVPRLISPWLKKKLEYKLRKIINLEYHIELSSSGVLTSAFALGKTVVCSKNKGYSEYVNPKRGVMCDNDVYSWENAIRYLLENPDVVKKMSANALEFANNEISVEKIATKHIKVYEKVLGNV